ncbi:fibroblast growth factor 2 isoform X5 [Mobula birostris]|uniref:fibroblast growth factor 2 isoform X5 n=1 Tax=Mobula birostris TaxID=1983395 RepID=UPI003B28379F
MAAAAGAGGVSTLPTLPDTGGNPFPPGSFKEPKRLYCKNGGYFLRILPDGRVDGTREKNDGNIKLQLQAESIGVISIKGICANRYLAMNEDGRLYGSAKTLHQDWKLEKLMFMPSDWRLPRQNLCGLLGVMAFKACHSC